MRSREYHWSLYHVAEKNQIDGLRTDQVEAVFAAVPRAQKREWFIWKEGFDTWKPFDDFPQLVQSLRKADDRVWEQPPPPPAMTSGMSSGTSAEPAPARAVAAAAAVATPAGAAPASTANTSAIPTNHAPTSAPAVSREDATRIVAKTVKPAKKMEDIREARTVVKVTKRDEGPKAAPAPRGPAIAKPKTSETKTQIGQKLVFEEIDEDSADLTLMRGGVMEDRNNMRFSKQLEIRISVNDHTYVNTTTDISLRGMHLREPLPNSLPRYFNVEIGRGEKTIPVVCSEVKSKDGAPSIRLKIESNEHASALLTLLLSGS